MTIQEQADAILQDGWRAHLASQDELLVRLAQDRDALLKALKALVERVEEGGAVKREGITGAAYNVWMANFGEDWCDVFNAAEAAIAQAERPR